jgi:rubrerythrin
MQPAPQTDEPRTDEPRTPSALEELRDDASSRKRFLKAVGGTSAAGALSVLIAACGGKPKAPPTPGGSDPNTAAGTGTDRYGKGDLGIVRYAVTLEYVEVDFYEKAVASGKLKGRALELAKRFGQQEQQHVEALEGAIRKLGGQPPAKPRANFPLQTGLAITRFALEIESLGAAAYLAQVDRIADKELLAAALSIHSVEGRHAAAFATLLKQSPAPEAFAQPAYAADVLNQLHSLTAPG